MLMPIIKDIEVLENYKILIKYENGKIKIYDMKPNLNYEAFKRVHPAGETIEWETGEDVNPEDLYFNSKEVK